MRGPYETSLDEFAGCVCTILEGGRAYSYYQVRKECGISYLTVKDYVTMERYSYAVNLRIVEECGRSIKPENIQRTYPGLRVVPPGDTHTHSDPCTTELGKETEKQQYIPRDLLPRRHSLLRDTEVLRMPSGRHVKKVLRVTPFLPRYSSTVIYLDGARTTNIASHPFEGNIRFLDYEA